MSALACVRIQTEDLQARIARLHILQGDLSQMAALGVKDVDGFSLSDFGSYCGGDIYKSCWAGVRAAAAPGARFCERIFMHDVALPFEDLRVDQDLSDRLTLEDRAVIYTIRAGRIGG